GVKASKFLIGLPSKPILEIFINDRGHAVSHSTHSFPHWLVSTFMSRTSCGKLSFANTERSCAPFKVTLIAPYGQVTSQIPQKLHFAKSISTLAFLAFSPWILGCFCVFMASLGHAKLHIWQLAQRFLSSVNL